MRIYTIQRQNYIGAIAGHHDRSQLQEEEAMKMLRDSLIHQGPTWAAIAAALLCAYALFSSLSLSQPALF
ncbi:MAG: hypothetical protein CMK33_00900 [Porticoccaceae bacterium]|nr:hypothetical protein [Porticoccaceae bacterium]